MENSETVFVGKKPILNYVLACLTQIKSGKEIIIISARGRNISRAVDVAEVLRNRYLPSVKIQDIVTGTETMNRDEKGVSNVSTIDIYIKA